MISQGGISKIGCKIDGEKIRKKIANVDKHNEWDTAYPSIDRIFHDKNCSFFGDLYQYRNTDTDNFISPSNSEDVSFIKSIIALLITPSNFEQVYTPSPSERQYLKKSMIYSSTNDDIITGAIYCILFVIFRHMSHGTRQESQQGLKKNNNFIIAYPIYRVMLDYNLVDMSYSATYKDAISSPCTLLYRCKGNDSKNITKLKYFIALCGKYENLKIVPGNCSKIENFFLYRAKHIHIQINLHDTKRRHVSTAEKESIKDNAFFTSGVSCQSYIGNSREHIIGVVHMNDFVQLFNDTLNIFKIYKKRNNEKKKRKSCSELLKLILKNSARVLTHHGYVWSLCPSFLRYEEKESADDAKHIPVDTKHIRDNTKDNTKTKIKCPKNIRYKIMTMVYGKKITNSIYKGNKCRLESNIDKRRRKKNKK